MTKRDSAGAGMDRRSFLKSAPLFAGAGAALIAPSAGQAQSREGAGRPDADSVQAGAGIANVATRSGTVAGYIKDGLYVFKGIPYAATTAGDNRFQPPRPPEPWTGVRSSLHYGFIAPQDKGTGRHNDEEAFIFRWNDSVAGEDCLRVNVWTPGTDDARRPVMVWLHGGGFAAGSGHDIPAFHGANLARRGDVVVVSLNHRLNMLGFLDLSEYGDRYARSGNVGMLDIVAALEWVRDNIAGFGGDPDRVLIFGQSGGGAKVSTLMAMPSAQGLFHRAVVQSGSFSLSNRQEGSRRLARLVVEELGLDAGSIGGIGAVPYEELERAGAAALRRVNAAPDRPTETGPNPANVNFGPVADGDVLPTLAFNPDAPAISNHVPMIIGTTLNEFASGINHPEYELMTEEEVVARVEGTSPGRGPEIVSAFRARTPDAKPFDIWSRIASASVRQAALRQAAAKAALGGAPAYLYWFTWQTPVLDGRPRAFHCAEIPFVFANSDYCPTMTGGGPRARALADTMTDAWIQFARTGDPNHPGMAAWPAFEPGAAPCMIFDDETRVEQAPDRAELASLSA